MAGTLSELTHGHEIKIFTASGDLASGNPPALPHAACAIGAPDGSVGSSDAGSETLFDSLSLSPDGLSLAYDYNGAIYVAHLTSLTACEEATVTQVIAGGSDPDWGPTNVNPAARPAALPMRVVWPTRSVTREGDKERQHP